MFCTQNMTGFLNCKPPEPPLTGVLQRSHPIEDAWPRHMDPAHFGQINFRGTMAFKIDESRDPNGHVDGGHRGSARACRHPSCPCRPSTRPLRCFENFGPATLLPVRRLLLTLLIAFLPLQFSWAAVASYCGHETQAGVEHFGHHTHQHHADAGGNGQPESASVATSDEGKVKALGAVDLDCGHCHGCCGVISTLPCRLPEALPSAASLGMLDQAGSEHAPSRPERPQWLPLA
jgi:hypothetical protein